MPIKNSQILVNFPMLKSSISLGFTIKPQVKSVVTGFFTLKIVLPKDTRLIFRYSTFQDPKINTSGNPLSACPMPLALFLGIFKTYPCISFKH